jgi:Domain of unknown function (DUF4440)
MKRCCGPVNGCKKEQFYPSAGALPLAMEAMDYSTDFTQLQRLRQLNAQFIANHVANDVASHDALLHPRFTYINSRGLRIARDTYLRNWAQGFDPARMAYWDTRDEQIRVFGNVALVSACNKYVELMPEGPLTAMAAYTDIYFHEDGQWRCIQAQITEVAAAHWPSDSSIVSVYRHGKPQPHGG